MSLKKILDAFYLDYDFEKRVSHDPIESPGKYAAPKDKEVSGFIATSFAYGKVDLFKPVINDVLGRMGPSPYAFLLNFNLSRQARIFGNVKYRFNRTEDIIGLLFILHKVLKTYLTIENAFMSFYDSKDGTVEAGLSGLMTAFLDVDTSIIYGRDLKPPGLLQFFPTPAGGSACKRANLFLRWMIRDRDIDFGIWRGVPKDKLVIPLDTHIARISRCLGLTERKSNDWKTAVEITTALKRFDPEDPLKYDFALCHQGISGLCKGTKDKSICSNCKFRIF